jgi:hypothetical protein
LGSTHESFYSFIEDACPPNKVLYTEALIDAVHAFLILVVRFAGSNRVETIAYTACFSEEARIGAASG